MPRILRHLPRPVRSVSVLWHLYGEPQAIYMGRRAWKEYYLWVAYSHPEWGATDLLTEDFLYRGVPVRFDPSLADEHLRWERGLPKVVELPPYRVVDWSPEPDPTNLEVD